MIVVLEGHLGLLQALGALDIDPGVGVDQDVGDGVIGQQRFQGAEA